MLVFFLLAFLMGITLVALRSQLSETKELAARDAAHDEYWRANSFAVDLEASVRADLVAAYHEEVRQARVIEQSQNMQSRLPVFDLPTETRLSQALVRFPRPDASWFDEGMRLRVPNLEQTGAGVNACTSLFGEFNSSGWLELHRTLPFFFAARRDRDVGNINPVLKLKMLYQETEQQPIKGGYPMVAYVLEFLIETPTGAEGEHAVVRKQGRITLEAAGAQVCADPAIIFVRRDGVIADPIEEGSAISFVWETSDAEQMHIEVIGTDGRSKGITEVVFPRLGDNSFTQTNVGNAWQTTAAIEDSEADTGTMRFRFYATRGCAASASNEVTITVNVRRLLVSAWARPWSQPSGEGLRERKNNRGDHVGYFHTWAELRGAPNNKMRFTVRVGYVMGDASGNQLGNGAPVRPTFFGNLTLKDAQSQTVEGIENLPLTDARVKAQWRGAQYQVNQTFGRGCSPRKCSPGSPRDSIMMTMQYVWEIDRPAGEVGAYTLGYNWKAPTIDTLRAEHNDIYSRRSGREDPWFEGVIVLDPRARRGGGG